MNPVLARVTPPAKSDDQPAPRSYAAANSVVDYRHKVAPHC